MTAEGGEGASASEQAPAGVGQVPVSWHFAPLVWVHDADYFDGDDALEAAGDDWQYKIHPVHESAGGIIGYQVSGGDYESSDQIGSAEVGGKRGELSLTGAKAAAEANYASRYCEAERFLDDLLDAWGDEYGPRTYRNEQGRIVCRVDESGIDEVEVVVSLRDYADGYDAARRSASVSLRTVLSFSHHGDPGGLVDDLRRLIRLESRGRGL